MNLVIIKIYIGPQPQDQIEEMFKTNSSDIDKIYGAWLENQDRELQGILAELKAEDCVELTDFDALDDMIFDGID